VKKVIFFSIKWAGQTFYPKSKIKITPLTLHLHNNSKYGTYVPFEYRMFILQYFMIGAEENQLEVTIYR